MTESTRADSASSTFLEQTLWQQLRAAEAPEDVVHRWLALQSQYLAGTRCAVVVLGDSGAGPYAPVSSWPDQDAPDPSLSAITERCLREKRPVVTEEATRRMAIPIEIDGELRGAVAAAVEAPEADSRSLLWQLRWGSAWLEALLRRHQGHEDEQRQQRTLLTFDLIGLVLEQDSFSNSLNALVTELALRFACDPVSIGFVESSRVSLKAVSHSAQFGEKMSFVAHIESAMEEAVDQDAVVLLPAPESWEYRVVMSHEALAESHQCGNILTLPLKSGGQSIGALTLERSGGPPFSEEDVITIDAAVSVLGPVLELQRRDAFSLWRRTRERARDQAAKLFGPHYLGRKLALTATLVLLGLFTVVTGEYRVTSPAVVEGLVQRAIIAPFDGYISSEHARAGEVVSEGQLLAELDDQDLALERIRWATKQRQGMAEYDQALARQERSAANIIRAELQQAEAQVQLLDVQLERTRVRAPFDGVLVAGDLSQKVGGAVRRGEEMFRLAPLEDHRVILEVDETDVMDLQVGQAGSLRLASLPDRTFDYQVTMITSIAEQAEGRNYFRVEAVLESDASEIRPGMEGIAKTMVEERLVIRIWTEKMVDWLRLFLWRWWP